MSRPRLPVIAGLSAGAGTSTLAAALHAIDGGRWTGGPVDVLVCGAEDDLAALPVVPVLVVRAGGPRPARAGAVVVLPDVPAWHGEDATRAAARLLGLGPQRRPPDLRGYAEALVAVVGALLRSGVLGPAAGPRVPPPPLPPAGAPAGRRPATGIPRPEPPAPTLRRPALPRTALPRTAQPRTAQPRTAQPRTAQPRTAELRPEPPAYPGPVLPEPAARPGPPLPAARPERPRRARRRVVVAADAGPALTAPAAGADPGSAAHPVGPGPVDAPSPGAQPGQEAGLPRLVSSTPAVPVLLHRAEPVRPRLVAGRALRIAPGPTPDPRPAARQRLRIAAPAAPPVAVGATEVGPDDDTIDGDLVDADLIDADLIDADPDDGNPVDGPAPGSARRTG